MNSNLQNTSAIHPALLAYVGLGGEQMRLVIDGGQAVPILYRRCIEQMYGSMTKIVQVYKVTVESTIGSRFKIDLECINAEKSILTLFPNQMLKC